MSIPACPANLAPRRICGGVVARWTLLVALVALVALAPAAARAADPSTPVADAAMAGDRATVRALLAAGADPNAAQGDGLTALHWAATNGDAELAEMLLWAGARLDAKTRNGAFTPLLVAARAGRAAVVEVLLARGAPPDQATATGATALMLAAGGGDVPTVETLLAHGAEPDATESAFGQTALVFAASANRAEAVAALIAGGADPALTTSLLDAAAIEKAQRDGFRRHLALQQARARLEKESEEQAAREAAEAVAAEAETDPELSGNPPAPLAPDAPTPGGADRAPATEEFDPELSGNPPAPLAAQPQRRGAAAPAAEEVDPELSGNPPAPIARPEDSTKPAEQGAAPRRGPDDEERKGPRPATMGELVGKQGGLTPLLHAAREGHHQAALALLAGGADVDQPSAGDRTTPLLMATLNGHFDLAMVLLQAGADPKLASDAGATPLYAALNVQWAPHAFYPQPSPAQEETTHLELMRALLDAGADVNARLEKKVWYTGYNFDQAGVDETGATPFWRAAQASDLAAMKLLVAAGADPTIATQVVPERRLPNGRNAGADLDAEPPALGSPAVTPLQVATGAGWVGNFHRNAPGGMLPAVRYLVEELGAEVREADYRRYTPLHHAAARGDDAMILYLVFRGAHVKAVARSGETVADMANGPVQRIQPFPETLALLEAMGSKNSGNCVSC
ncbi:MAG TPA: ankyrin repeat domain-containing protein [Thermoanaerobaculia bacterium]|nr:ankyrin repeat domain-containing protein [Thermoanaerobaculia bacterium]